MRNSVLLEKDDDNIISELSLQDEFKKTSSLISNKKISELFENIEILLKSYKEEYQKLHRNK